MTEKVPFPKDSTKQIILEDLSSARGSRKIDEEIELAKLHKKRCMWSNKAKILVAVGVVLILIAAGLGIGLYYRFRDRVQPISPVNRVSLGNGNYVAMGEFEVRERNFFSKDVTQRIILTQGIRKTQNQNSRLLQEQEQEEEVVDYSATVNLQQVGFGLTYTSDGQMGVQVESQKLFDYLMATEPDAARVLAEVMEIQDVDEAATIEDLEKQLSQVFNEELGTDGAFEFHQTPIVELKVNSQTSNFEISTQNGTAIKDARRLLIIRILFFRQLFEGIKKVVKAIVRPVVEFVRNHGATIGKVAGAVIGFVAGGPAGAKLGMKIGEGIGLAAQTFVKACVPRDVLTIRCTGESVKQAGIDLAKDLGKKVLSSAGSSIWNSLTRK